MKDPAAYFKYGVFTCGGTKIVVKKKEKKKVVKSSNFIPTDGFSKNIHYLSFYKFSIPKLTRHHI